MLVSSPVVIFERRWVSQLHRPAYALSATPADKVTSG